MKTNNILRLSLYVIISFLFILTNSCFQTEVVPVLTTSDVTSITQNTATCGGFISFDGGSDIVSRGVCYSIKLNPTTSDNKTINAAGTGEFVSLITGLVPNTEYYIRAYATNSKETAYGNQIKFKTLYPTLPIISTNEPSEITYNSAISGGNIIFDGGLTVLTRGVCWNLTGNPTIINDKTTNGGGMGSFTSSITNLDDGTTYYIKAYATNNIGTTYGNEISFKTIPAILSTVNTSKISSITSSSAIVDGQITNNGGGKILECGVCWNTLPNPIIENSKSKSSINSDNFQCFVSGLKESTLYYVRAYSINSAGINYGNTLIFKTYTGTVTDIDGNIYNTVTIGTQTWMVENLKTTRFRNGEQIPYVPISSDWINLSTGAYCWYNDDITNKDLNGALYNWYVVNDSRMISPVGWHVASVADWTKLITYLGGTNLAGGKLKESGTLHWRTPNVGATNESGFTALPSGLRSYTDGRYWYGPMSNHLYSNGHFWSSSEKEPSIGWGYDVDSSHSAIYKDYDNKNVGYSIRCIKD